GHKVTDLSDSKARHPDNRVELGAVHALDFPHAPLDGDTRGAIAADQRLIPVAGMTHELDRFSGNRFEPAREEVPIKDELRIGDAGTRGAAGKAASGGFARHLPAAP